MRIFKNLPVIFLAAGLTACGGGADTADELSQGAQPQPVAVNKLTIQGAVTDDPIDAAQVSFRIGERHYQASRDSDVDGGFSVDIEYDSLDDLVYGEALRDASGIHLVGSVMTVRELLARASGGVVSGTKITNLTTAKFVLAAQATDDGSIDNYAEFDTASRGVDPTALVTVGAAIKVVVEAIDGTVMPPDATTTLELAERIANGSSSFVGDLNALSPQTMSASIQKMLTDGHATEDFDLARVAGVYMSTTSLAAYALFADGSGLVNYFDDRDIERIRDWSINADGDLTLTYAAAGAGQSVLQILSGSGAALQINQVRGAPTAANGAFDVANFEFYDFSGRFDAAAVAGTYASVDDSAADFVLGVDGSGFFLDAQGTVAGGLSWMLAGDGRLVISLPSGRKTVMTRLAGDGGVVKVLAIGTRTGGMVESMLVQSYTKS